MDPYKPAASSEEPPVPENVSENGETGQTTTCDSQLPMFALIDDRVIEIGKLAKGTPVQIVDSDETHAIITLPDDPWLTPAEGVRLAVKTVDLETCTLPKLSPSTESE